MPIRRGRPGLIGTMARTAVVAGTATATVNAVSNHSEKKQQAAAQQQQAAYEQQQQQAAYAQQQAVAAAPAPAAAPAAGGITEEALAQLKQLGDLKAAGVLTDEEFTAAKAKILGI